MMLCEKGKVFKRENEGVETMGVVLKRHFSWCDVICIKKYLLCGGYKMGCLEMAVFLERRPI